MFQTDFIFDYLAYIKKLLTEMDFAKTCVFFKQ